MADVVPCQPLNPFSKLLLLLVVVLLGQLVLDLNRQATGWPLVEVSRGHAGWWCAVVAVVLRTEAVAKAPSACVL